MPPFFSIIIPSYNRAHIIDRAVERILEQTFQDFELIVVDDGSIDETKEVLQKYCTNEKVRYVYQDNKGVCAARNTGAKQASGEFLIFLDSDDSVEKSWLEDFYSLNGGGFNILFCNMKLVKTNGKEELYSSYNPYNNSKAKGVFSSGAWAVQRKLFFKVGMYDKAITFGENIELGYRLEMYGLKKGIVDKFNFIYYDSIDGGSKNLQNKIDSNIYITKKHVKYFKKRRRLLVLYYQNIGVALAKTNQLRTARLYFWKAFLIDVKKLKNIVRIVLTFFPFLAKRQWK